MLLYAGSDSYTEFSPDLWYALKKLGSKVTGIKERSDNNSGPPLPKMAYSGLLAPQGKLASAGDWGGWNSSEQLEFLGGTQALLNWCELESSCKADRAAPEPGLEQVAAISKVHGEIANMPSDKQYNIEVAWQPGADKCFEHARGWGIHLAQLHPGMYGYDQNKMNDSLLGWLFFLVKTIRRRGNSISDSLTSPTTIPPKKTPTFKRTMRIIASGMEKSDPTSTVRRPRRCRL